MCVKIQNEEESVPFAKPVIRRNLWESQRNGYGRRESERQTVIAPPRVEQTTGAVLSVQKPRCGGWSVTVRSPFLSLPRPPRLR